MDRDVYLILVGAGISLVSSIITLVFQFALSLIKEKIQNRQEEKRIRKQVIVNELTRKDFPIIISKPKSRSGGMIPGIQSPHSSFIRLIHAYKGFSIFGYQILIHKKYLKRALIISLLISVFVFASFMIPQIHIFTN